MLRDIYNGLVFMFISLSISAESTLASFQEALLKHVPNLLPGDFICYNSKDWVPCQVMHFCALHYYYLIILALTMVTVVFLVTAMAGNDPSARSGWKIPVNWRWNQSGLSCQSNQRFYWDTCDFHIFCMTVLSYQDHVSFIWGLLIASTSH